MPLKHDLAFWILSSHQTLCQQCGLNLSENAAAPSPEKVDQDLFWNKTWTLKINHRRIYFVSFKLSDGTRWGKICTLQTGTEMTAWLNVRTWDDASHSHSEQAHICCRTCIIVFRTSLTLILISWLASGSVMFKTQLYMCGNKCKMTNQNKHN